MTLQELLKAKKKVIRRKSWSRDSYIRINTDGTIDYWDNDLFLWSKKVLGTSDLIATDWQEVK